MVKNIEFKGNRNNFQSKLKDDLKKVKTSGKIMVFVDKTTNMYEMSKEDYVMIMLQKRTKKQHYLLKQKSIKKQEPLQRS